VIRTFGIGAAGPSDSPSPIVSPAVFAGTTAGAFGVIVGILVEGDGIERMHVAEDIATAPAVVTASEVGEVSCASCFVADCRIGIGL
jgi:hypothetical protein